MSGTSERLKYDPNTYVRDLKQSTDPLRYQLMPLQANHCQPCRAPDVGYLGGNGVSITHQRPLVDVESDLLLLNYAASRDPGQKYAPMCPQPGTGRSGYPCGGGVVGGQAGNVQEQLHHFPECHLLTEHTRLSNPTCTMRGTGINRFTPLCLDPQHPNRWEHPSECGIAYRMVVKDNHRPCVPQPLSQTAVLPTGGPLPQTMVQPPVEGNFLGALHPNYVDLNRNWNGLT